jgi:hypothetical protein
VVNGAASSLGTRQPIDPDAEIHFMSVVGGG